ncbi:MAG: mechanosensitive ion channel family protein [Anaerolineales bacterium]|nr:mechanosensitive ion channel family protein [Anaerolineales bacterium]MCB9128930.1 mechanosensitive ion channel family protein [Ardenticatenales bacterium]
MDPIEETVGIFQPAVDTINRFVASFIATLPNLIAALLVFGIGLFIAGLVERAAQRALARVGRPQQSVMVLSRLVRYAANLVALFLAITVLLPEFTATSLLTGVGFGSVAVGFAFRDILQNFLAGILILLTEPFRIGDQIVMDSFEGTVDDIQIRATLLKTYDGRRVVIPNADIYTHVVVVNTAFPQRRSEYDVGIGYGDDFEKAKRTVLAAVRQVEGVSDSPAPDVLMGDLADSSVLMRVRWWTNSPRSDVIHVQERVIAAIKSTLDVEGIEIPYPIQTMRVLGTEPEGQPPGDPLVRTTDPRDTPAA